ncbi:hypothetical protein [Stenotrophomonas maltophilia]|uniref:hypothetical protein n=1 Tax=Stenotrophomonas maltophilia TaxID=40324 RepID=UPI0040416C3C
MTNDRFPWDKNPVTPEAMDVVAQASAAQRLRKLRAESTPADRRYVRWMLGLLVVLGLTLPVLLIFAVLELF